jgi:hypothetical protein
MEWSEFTRLVREDLSHSFKKRLELLRTSQALFSNVSRFQDLSKLERRSIAGVVVSGEGVGDLVWGCFGGMKGNGDFVSRINNNNLDLSAAINVIPRDGEISKTQYETFCDYFKRAFADATHKGGVPTATRLLAMKRPDNFICICSPNRKGIAEALKFAPTTLNLENYWECVIEPIRMSSWYNHPRPNDLNTDLWDNRVAMLDALYYNP